MPLPTLGISNVGTLIRVVGEVALSAWKSKLTTNVPLVVAAIGGPKGAKPTHFASPSVSDALRPYGLSSAKPGEVPIGEPVMSAPANERYVVFQLSRTSTAAKV